MKNFNFRFIGGAFNVIKTLPKLSLLSLKAIEIIEIKNLHKDKWEEGNFKKPYQQLKP